jgi:iron complex transport system ATP-binding protein
MRLSVDIKSVSLGKKEILSNISFAPSENSFTTVIGRNGSGKSTLVSAISGLLHFEGRVSVCGFDVSKTDRRTLSKYISLLPQKIQSPHIRVEDLVAYGRSPYKKSFFGRCDDDGTIIEDALIKANVSSLRDCYLDRISGGELRRAYFAMMLAQNTDVAVFDEATAFMDADFERQFVAMQKELAKNKTVISVMHNLTLAVAYADAILVLDGGKQIFFGTPNELLATDIPENIFHVKRHVADGNVFFG